MPHSLSQRTPETGSISPARSAQQPTDLSSNASLSIQIAFMIEVIGLRVGEIAFACGVTRQTVRNWRRTTGEPRDMRYEDLRVVCEQMLDAGMTERLIGAWLRAPDRGLGNVRPLDAIRAKRLTEVVHAARAFTAGSSLPASMPPGGESRRAVSLNDPDVEFQQLNGDEDETT